MRFQRIKFITSIRYVQRVDVYYQFELQNQMNQSSDQCAICNQQPEDMLILACGHNLCLDCATQLFTASSDQVCLQCEICLSTTPLDQQTITCLRNLAQKDLGEAYEAVQYPILPKPNTKRNQWECIQHGQVSMYYCVQCNDIRICSECILAKKHFNHKVMTIKKAAVFLLERIQHNVKDLQTSKIGLKESQQYLLGVKEKMVSEYEEKQSNLKVMFQTIMRNIEYKYNQLKSQMEALSKRSFQMIQGTLNRIKQKEQIIDLQIKSNKQVLSNKNQDEVFLRCMQFQNYKQNQHLAFPQLSMSHFNIPPFNLPYHEIIKDFDRIILKIKWNQETKQTKVRQNEMIESIKAQSINDSHDKMREKYEEGIQNMSYGWQNSMQKYSGIKGGNSRRLQMSRSIDNATNIINKLQERIKK